MGFKGMRSPTGPWDPESFLRVLVLGLFRAAGGQRALRARVGEGTDGGTSHGGDRSNPD